MCDARTPNRHFKARYVRGSQPVAALGYLRLANCEAATEVREFGQAPSRDFASVKHVAFLLPDVVDSFSGLG